jgi:NADH-quinone oxidoreductase subunit M
MSYLLLTLLLLPLVGSGLVFAWKNPASKYLALGIAFVEMFLTFYILANFNSIPTVDSALDYEITRPWSNFIKSTIHFGIDGMSLLMLLLTNILTALIILSSFNEKPGYSNSFYGLILLMQFGLVGVFTPLDGILGNHLDSDLADCRNLGSGRQENPFYNEIFCLHVRRIIIYADRIDLRV